MRIALFLALTTTALGCSKRSDEPKPAPTATGVEVSGSNAAADPPSANINDQPMDPGTTASGINLNGLNDMLKSERDHRGAGPSTDALFGAIEKASYTLERRKQLLAKAAGASFCEDARIADLIILICEFSSDKTAEAGKVLADKNWTKAATNVTRVLKGATLISIVHGGNRTADVDKILAAINAV